ncbi:MAG: hypothetical protein KR126chlam6_01226 [Candidatus Anoxychlamydiales bacterium]|nr:hypothetical protein [Candidatus Anoxychlamydiales bacterium]
MLESLFGNKNIEKILFFLLANKKCYPYQLQKRFDVPLYGMQKALDRLEKSQLLVSFLYGKTRMYEFNPMYPFLKEFKFFLQKAYDSLPNKIKNVYYEPVIRTRPRKRTKPL